MNLFKIVMILGTLVALSACGDKEDTDTSGGDTTSDSGS